MIDAGRGDEIGAYLTEAGFDLVRLKGLACASPRVIAVRLPRGNESSCQPNGLRRWVAKIIFPP